MRRLPTDREMLNLIYGRYYKDFESYQEGSREAKMYVPMDIKALSKDLQTDPDMIFGRLYYHLDKKYAYQTGDNTWVRLFTPRLGEDKDCVQFPLLASVLADLQEQHKRHLSTIFIAAGSFAVSAAALALSIVGLT